MCIFLLFLDADYHILGQVQGRSPQMPANNIGSHHPDIVNIPLPHRHQVITVIEDTTGAVSQAHQRTQDDKSLFRPSFIPITYLYF